MEIGIRKRAYTGIFQPFDAMQRYYVKPYFEYKELNDLVPIGMHVPNMKGKRELTTARYGGGLAFGAHVTTDYEFEAGASIYRDNVVMDFITFDQEYRARPIYASFKSDSLDNIHFPKTGLKSEILWTKEMGSWGSDYDYEQIYLEVEKPFTLYSNNLTAFLKLGSTYKIDGRTPFVGTYTLGGLFNLSGYAPYSLNDNNMVLGVLKYRYELKDGGFFGNINAPLYAGFTLEAGDTWGLEKDFSAGDIKKSATIYVAADTFLGPFYLAYGASIEGEHSAYLYLGEKF